MIDDPVFKPLFPTMILYLASSYGLNEQKTNKQTFRIILQEMSQHPEKFIYEPKIAMLLTAIGYLMVGVHAAGHLDSLKSTVRLLLQLWKNVKMNEFVAEDEDLEDLEKSTSGSLVNTQLHPRKKGISLTEHGMMLFKLFQYVFTATFNRGNVDEEWASMLRGELAWAFDHGDASTSVTLLQII
jgi:hypothetical protein